MSSDRINRKRRSENDISDDAANELPPGKIRRSESGSHFGSILTDKLKNFFNWISPESVKKYMIDIFKKPGTPNNSSSLDMVVPESMKNNCIEDDDDEEIAVIGVQNGISGARSRIIKDHKHSSLPKVLVRPPNASICPLASTPLNFPLFSHGSSRDNSSKAMEHRRMNGYPFRREPSCTEKFSRKRTGSEKCVAPITNPSSDIEILLKEDSLIDDKEVEILSEYPAKHSPGPIRKSRFLATDFYNSSRKEKAIYAEDLINGISFKRPHPTNKSYTAHEYIRLQEKAQYERLLDKVVKRSVYHPAIPKRDMKTSAIQVDLTEDEEKPIIDYHFKKEKVNVSGFLSKYYKPCSLVPLVVRSVDFQQKPKPNMPEKEENEVQIIESSDLPKLKPRKKSSVDETILSPAWINDLTLTVQTETQRWRQAVSAQEEKIERYKKRRDAKNAEEQRKRDELRKAGIIFDEDVDMEEDVLPEITPEMDAIINDALRMGGDPNEKLSSLERVTLTRNDVQTLSSLNWLNDQVINFYLSLIEERSKLDNYPSVHLFNSFFYTSLKTRGPNNVLRWTRRIDIFSYDLIIVPLHLEMHWALLVVDNRKKTITYYDSMCNGEDRCLKIIQNYLIVEMQDKKKVSLDPNAYKSDIPKDIPKQMNGSDCGMFTLKYAEYISRDAPITFTQENMPYFRRRMVYELLTKRIL